MTCRKCGLWRNAANVVPGEGPLSAQIMLVGQNPGSEEDKTGRPFVGRSGKFLDTVLAKNDIDRNNLFITNLVKHVTPRNRKPLPAEIAACSSYLETQIKKIKPSIIVLMGTVAWQAPRIKGVEFIETYHPSAAMRFKKIRKRFERDFQVLKKKHSEFL